MKGIGPGSLGPQCYSCRKRRVKCDSGVPNCSKCLKVEIDCPGYTKPMKWRVTTSSSVGNRTTRLLADSSAASSSALIEANMETNIEPSSIPVRTETSFDCLPIPNSLCFATKELFFSIDSVDYFNKEILPDLAPSWPASQRQGILIQQWGEAPPVIDHVLKMLVLRHQQLRKGKNAEVGTEIYRYRGLVISELNGFLQNSFDGSNYIALVAVLMMLQAEMELAAMGQWKVHLAGARQLIALHGGLKACIGLIPSGFIFPMLSDMVLIDVLSSATTSAGRLTKDDLEAHIEYLDLIEILEPETLASWCPCPVPVFRQIIEINRLRMLSSYPNQSNSCTNASWITAKDALMTFDAFSWVGKLFTESTISPISGPSLMETKVEWAFLGEAYQAATVLYLLRTCPAGGEGSEPQGDANPLIVQYKSRLGTALHRLFVPFSVDPRGKNGPRLWRFCMWPLFVDAYDAVLHGHSRPPDLPVESIHVKIERFYSVGVRMGTSTMGEIADMLSDLLKSQKQGVCRSWDDGFPDYPISVI